MLSLSSYSPHASLYQVKRGSDSATTNISPLSAGGVSNAAAQDRFCAGTTCLITVIYDQSGRGNHLTQAPPGGFSGPEANGYDNLASAIGAPVTLNGQRAYGVFISPGKGYRNNAVTGTPIGDQAEGIYFGDNSVWGTGAGSGPWIMADLENGLFSGISLTINAGDPSISHRFLTAIVKGGPNLWAIRGGNAASGSLSTFYGGIHPNKAGYNPMSKEGAINLGIGGDNSVGAQGTFYEGVMTSGYPSESTENAVQTNIVAAGYAITSLISGTTLNVGSSISLRATTSCCTTRYLAHTGSTVNTQVVSSSSTTALKQQASWTVRTGLGNSVCFSFESKDTPGNYIRHYNFALMVSANDGSKQFQEDATFCSQAGLSGQGSSIRAWRYPTRYFRHYDNVGFVSSNSGVHTFDATGSFNDNVSWIVSAGLA
ncbi:alpha-L-arabinofuranosidase B domain protein [Colletotrichum sojae]|uniref:Alpha-L-arabinofuranosidase n=1 Tax=Colletotrichum sojae TaxID=2175907 RepID=A0A8H6N1N0_9PEZI|nr:alpha-L-arabinofuranosidase B domain protein [Colletotrichum sojae]